MNLGNAYALATALYARDTSLPVEDIADKIYHCVEVLEFGQDERKADLYAQLAEQLTPDTGFLMAQCIIEEAMDATDKRYPK